jgi:GTPase SAR1 family protein
MDDWDTFEHVTTLRDHIIRLRPDIPIVVVGNKIDLERKMEEKSG